MKEMATLYTVNTLNDTKLALRINIHKPNIDAIFNAA